MPKIVQLEHTTRCNFECIACNHFYQKNYKCHDLNFKVVEKLTEIFPYAEQIQLNGGGEPFIAPRLEEALEIYSHYGLKITTTTNLSYLTDRILQIIKKSFSSLNLSCDGATQEIFGGIRKNGKLSEYVENLRKVRAASDRIRLVMGITAMRQNIRQLPEIVELAHQLGINKVVIGRMIPRPSQIPFTVQDDLINYPHTANHYIPIVCPMKFPAENGTSMEREMKIMDSYPLFPTGEQQQTLFE